MVEALALICEKSSSNPVTFSVFTKYWEKEVGNSTFLLAKSKKIGRSYVCRHWCADLKTYFGKVSLDCNFFLNGGLILLFECFKADQLLEGGMSISERIWSKITWLRLQSERNFEYSDDGILYQGKVRNVTKIPSRYVHKIEIQMQEKYAQ